MTKLISMLINFFLLLLLLEWSESCGAFPYTYKSINYHVSDNVQAFPWLVVIRENEDPIFKLGYGALIHPQIVITTTLTVEWRSAKNLLVQANCSMDSGWVITNCSEIQVKEIIAFNSDQKSHYNSEHFYVLLILEHPFMIDAVKMAINVSDINPNNCYFLRWMRELSENYTKKKLVIIKYKTLFNNGQLNISNFDYEQLWTDKDFIISRAFHLAMVTQRIPHQNFLNFNGSPSICQDKQNPRHYFLVGLGTFNLKISNQSPITGATLSHNSFNITYDGSLINIINYSKNISRNINSIIS